MDQLFDHPEHLPQLPLDRVDDVRLHKLLNALQLTKVYVNMYCQVLNRRFKMQEC